LTRAAFRWFALALLFAAGSAAGHTRSQSHSVWEINGTAVDLVMTIPTIETERIGNGATAPSDDRIKSYLTARVYPIAAGRRCVLAPPVETLAALSGYHKYDFTFKCDTAEDLQIHSAAFFDLVPSHTNFAQIQNAATGEFTEQLIPTSTRRWMRPADRAAGSRTPASSNSSAWERCTYSRASITCPFSSAWC
jgi:hypothetical protein